VEAGLTFLTLIDKMMETLRELHQEHIYLLSEIKFFQTEVKFLLKLISKEYKNLTEPKKVKLLDSYWKEFEAETQNLKKVEKEIENQEKNFASICQDHVMQANRGSRDENGLLREYLNIRERIRLLKESLYAYFSDAHHA
jgi:hypothetical protein